MKYSINPILLAFVTVFVGCAKERPYDEVNKTSDLLSADFIQPKQKMLDMCSKADPCLYLPSVGDTPYAVTASRPFSQGDQKIVVAHIVKDKIHYLELDTDKRFQDNINNQSPVFNLNIEHIDYKCVEDKYGDCTNKEEVDKDKHWSKRRNIKVSDVEVIETNSLPIDLKKLFNQGCFNEIDKNIEFLKVESDSINISVKKTYKTAASCLTITEFADLRYATFTVDYKYSIVKLSSLVDSKYSVVNYPKSDEMRFGFFTSKLKQKTIENFDHVMGVRKTLLNRWSPNRDEIVYNLNSNFYTEKNKAVLRATKQAFASINDSLQAANSKIKIILKKGDDQDIGNLKKNFVILVKDPQASGVVGYGPTVSNPKTGEIINGRLVMYFGTIQKFVSRAYNELVDEVIAKANGKVQSSPSGNAGSGTSTDTAVNMTSTTNTSYANYISQQMNFANLRRVFSSRELKSPGLSKKHDIHSVKQEEKIVYKSYIEKITTKINSLEQKMSQMAEQTYFHGSNINFDDAVIDALTDDIAKGRGLKKWESLTESERAIVMEKLIPYVWIPTLVHEIGHNLGLRHNFKGSYDSDNYYTKSERQALGLKRDVTYSSIMDYAPTTKNELMVLGKYDVAALRFGYAREVELTDGSFYKFSGTLKEKVQEVTELKIKKYAYCSDEHVSNDVLCNRFDDGDTYSKIANFYIDSYSKNYEKVNFRRRKYSFESRRGDEGYLNRLFSNFQNIRQFFDIFDREAFDGAYQNKEWSEDSRLVDIKSASDASFNFFMDVIEQPAYHCLEFDTELGQVTRVAPFTEMAKGTKLEDYGISFDIREGCMILNQYAPKNKAYAQFGKYFNNSLDLLYDRSQIAEGDSSQIDVRGMWMDKMVATMFTSIRMTSPTTIGSSSAGNYLDYPQYEERMLKTINSILTNNMSKEVEITLPSGQKQMFNVEYNFENNHMINKSYNAGINAFFKLKNSRTSLKVTLLDFLKRRLINDQDVGDVENDDALSAYYYFDIEKVSTRLDLAQFNYDKIVEFKNKNGKVNHRFGVYSYNGKAIELTKMKSDLELAQMIEDKLVIKAFEILTNKDQTFEQFSDQSELSSEQLSDVGDAISLGVEFLNAYLSGSMNDQVLLSSFLALSRK